MLKKVAIKINLFNIVSEDFFRPLTSKYKNTYIDCLRLIYSSYKTELSFGIDKEIIVTELENYFDREMNTEIIFEDDGEVAKDSRSKANGILRRLKESGWIEIEIPTDHRPKVNLLDYSATMIESFNKIIQNEEMEYQSYVSQIHATLLNQESYVKPYEYIIKRVIGNTEELMLGLKKLNTNIKKYIDAITSEKTANEILQDYFIYHKEIGSKAFNRIMTSDNVSRFRTAINENLFNILNDRNIFNLAVTGYMEIEQVEHRGEAEEQLRSQILNIITAFRNYDNITQEISNKNTKYIKSSVARAKFLLSDSNNSEGKLNQILKSLAEIINNDDKISLNDEVDETINKHINIFPQGYIDNESLATVYMSKKVMPPQPLNSEMTISDEEVEKQRKNLIERNKNIFSIKNINEYVEKDLSSKKSVLASSIPLNSKRDFIRLIFINLYGSSNKTKYKVIQTDETIVVNGFQFNDFIIERCI